MFWFYSGIAALVCFGFFALGFKAGAIDAKTYTCRRCGEYDEEQARIEADEERFRRESAIYEDRKML